MINSNYNVALSGLMTQSKTVEVASSNIVNANNSVKAPLENEEYKGYTPLDVEQTTTQDGGVQPNITPRNPAYNMSIEADMELRANPNVDIGEEIIKTKMAYNAYKANVKTINTQSEMDDTLIDSMA